MTAKRILFDTRARHRLLAGVDALANAVKVTLGPRGRHVAFEKGRGTRVTKDGVTVARQIWLEDHIANLGAQMVREVAAKTADAAGDGTTTATVLTQAIVSEGFRLVSAGYDPMQLKRGLDRGVRAVVARLKETSKPLQSRLEIAQVAAISANGDATIGEMVATAMDTVGRDGVITVEEATGLETTLEVVEGTRFGRGYISPYFVTDAERMRSILVEPYVLFTEKTVTLLADLVPVLEGVVQAQRPLLIVAEDVDGEALAALVVNKLSGTLEVAVVKAPGLGDPRKELLSDLAILTGGQVVSDALGVKLDKLALVHLGRCQRVEIDKGTTTLVGGQGDVEAITARVELIRRRMRDSTSDHDREQLRERLAKLTGSVAVIKVGAASELELKQRKDLVEDAIHATQAAAQEGVVAGGGVALLRCQPVLDELRVHSGQAAGVQVLRRALEAPLRQIAENAAVNGSVVTQRVREGKSGFGYNAAIERYEDLLATGVIDPTKVVRVALENAVSEAGLLLTTQAVVTEKPRASSEASPSRELAYDGVY